MDGRTTVPRTATLARGGAADNESRQTRTWQFTKTKLCKFHIIGMCVKGENCPFAHDKEELRPLPDLTCTKLCKRLIQTGSCEDRTCTYAHTKDELRATSTFHKTKLCRFSQNGHCALGSKCNFAHSPEEVRPLEVLAASTTSTAEAMLAQQVPDRLYNDHLPEAHLLLQQQFAEAQHQRGEMEGYMVNFPSNPPHFLTGLSAHTLLAAVGPEDGPCHGQAYPPVPGPGAVLLPRARREAGNGVAPVGPRAPGGQLPRNPAVPAPPAAVAPVNSTSKRRGPRGAKEGREGSRPERSGKGHNKASEGESADANSNVNPHTNSSPNPNPSPNPNSNSNAPPVQKASTGKTFDGPAQMPPGMSDSDMSGSVPMTGMPGLDWIARQGVSAPQMQAGLSAAQEAAYGASHAAQFANASQHTSENYRDCPAYVTQTASDFVVKNTFLEFQSLGGPLRPVRSAAGRLDVLGSGGESSEGLCDLTTGIASHGSAGSLSTEDRTGVGDFGSEKTECTSQAPPRQGVGPRYLDEGDTGGGSSMRSDSTQQSGFGACKKGEWDEALLQGSFTVDQKDDVWQVKNTFLTFAPHTKPIRSVRTAEGALCTLAALGDDEP